MSSARQRLGVLLLAVAILVGEVAFDRVRASMIQDVAAAACKTDACCRAMYLRGVTAMMPWCVADVVTDAQEGGCRVVPRCGLNETCLEATRECMSTAHMATLHGSAVCGNCSFVDCNLCDGFECNATTCACEQVATPKICSEGTQCSLVDQTCKVQTCTTASDCSSDGIFCNGVPVCDAGNCAVLQPCSSDAPLCAESLQKCNTICVTDVECTLPSQTFCDNYRQCDAEADLCLRQSVPRCNPSNETCDPLNEICTLAPPAPIPEPPRSSLVNGNVLVKWVLLIWLITFIGVVLCAVIIWLSRKPATRTRRTVPKPSKK